MSAFGFVDPIRLAMPIPVDFRARAEPCTIRPGNLVPALPSLDIPEEQNLGFQILWLLGSGMVWA